MNENEFQSKVIKEIKKIFPKSIVIKTDPGYLQGVPDLLVLLDNTWFALEVKKNATAKHRPNQDYYVSLMNRMSWARFVHPENFKEVVNELARAFGVKI